MTIVSKSKITKYVLTAVFAAMVFVGTVVIQISIPATGGYINMGDVFILLAAWSMGSLYGGIAGAVGAGLVDLLMFPIYAPATIIIKFVMGVTAALFVKKQGESKYKIVGLTLGAFASEAIMIGGYLIYEAFILGLGKAAIAGIFGNLIQGGASIAIALVLAGVLEKTKFTKLIEKRL